MPLDFTKETEDVTITKIYLSTNDGHRFSYPLLFSVIEMMQTEDCYEGVSFDHEAEEEIASYLAEQGYLTKSCSNRYGTVFHVPSQEKLEQLMTRIAKIVGDKQEDSHTMLIASFVSFINRFLLDGASAEEVGEDFTNLLKENSENPELNKASEILTAFVTNKCNYINSDAEDAIISLIQEVNHWSNGYCYHDENGNERKVGTKYRLLLKEAGIDVDPNEY